MRILVTGGSGKLGQAVVQELLAHGHSVVNADQRPPASRSAGGHYVQTILSDVGQVAGAMAGCDGVIHLGAIPHPYGHPDEVVFMNNVNATFATLQAAALLGIKKAVIASSISALGTAYAPDEHLPLYAPVDEAHPLLVKDCYGLSKEVDERTAEMFHRRTGMQVIALRFHWVATPEEARARAAELAADPRLGAAWRLLWGYVDIRDAAAACRLAIEANGLGFEPVNVVAADTLSGLPTEDLIRTYAPAVDIRTPIPGTNSGFALDKGRRLLGWTPQYTWRA